MSLFKLVVPAVALASGAYAASCSTSGTLTLTNSADASGLSSCQTYSGSIAIATDATDITIPVSRITENFVTVPEGVLNSLSAPSLQTVDGAMTIRGQASISSLSMPELTMVNNFTLNALGPNLLQLDFGTPGLTQVSSLDVSATYLQNFNGINLKTADIVNVASNSLLKDLTMQIRNVTGMLSVRGNAQGLNVDFPNLETAGSVLINDCSMVSMPEISNVTDEVSFAENEFESLALPNLAAVGPGTGGFNVDSCSSLSNLTTPMLARVAGAVAITANPELTGAIAFPSLQRAGSGQFTGAFSNLSIPNLATMPGTLVIRSSKNIQSTCNHFEGNNDIALGPVTCRSTGPTTSSDSSSSSSTPTNNAGLLYGPSSETAFGVFGGLAALFGLFM